VTIDMLPLRPIATLTGWVGRVIAGFLLATVMPVATLDAQNPPLAGPPLAKPAVVAGSTQNTAEPRSERLVVTAGRSRILTTDFDITRIAVTNPAVADATVVQLREVLVDGKAAGTVSLIVWGIAQRRQYDVVVEPPVSTLQQHLQALFPGEDIRVSQSDEALLLSGNVSSTAIMLKAGEIAQASTTKARVINLLELPGGATAQQVLLQVRFAEVNRQAVTQLGSSIFTGATGYKDFIFRGTTGRFSAPEYEGLSRTEVNGEVTELSGQITFSDFLNLFVFNTKYNIGAVIRALQESGYFQSLAEPNLIAYNGQEASFLAGGEFPVPVVQGVTGMVTINWREFGVRLTFKPTIAGDVIRLHVEPEVSSLDFNNGITLSGFRVPALTMRRAKTEIELRDGQSFAIAGLLNNQSEEGRSAIPVLSRIPIIGSLFKSKATRAEQTELMVLITPRLVRALEPDEVPPLPTQPGKFIRQEPDSRDPLTEGLADAPPVTPSAKPGTVPPKVIKE